MPLYDFSKSSDEPGVSHFLRQSQDLRTEDQKINSSLSIFQEDSPEVLTARTNADEMINTSGAEIRVYPRTDNADFDIVWDEDPDPTYLNHYNMKAFYKPSQLKTELKKWGIDTSAPTEIVFSHRQLYEKFGERMLRDGDVIYIPFNAASINPTHYRVTNGSPTGNFRYTWLYFTCQTDILRADSTIRVKDDIQDRNEIEPSGSGFRESY